MLVGNASKSALVMELTAEDVATDKMVTNAQLLAMTKITPRMFPKHGISVG